MTFEIDDSIVKRQEAEIEQRVAYWSGILQKMRADSGLRTKFLDELQATAFDWRWDERGIQLLIELLDRWEAFKRNAGTIKS